MDKSLIQSMASYGLNVMLDDSCDQKELLESLVEVAVLIQNGKKPAKQTLEGAIACAKFAIDQYMVLLTYLEAMYEEK